MKAIILKKNLKTFIIVIILLVLHTHIYIYVNPFSVFHMYSVLAIWGYITYYMACHPWNKTDSHSQHLLPTCHSLSWALCNFPHPCWPANWCCIFANLFQGMTFQGFLEGSFLDIENAFSLQKSLSSASYKLSSSSFRIFPEFWVCKLCCRLISWGFAFHAQLFAF